MQILLLTILSIFCSFSAVYGTRFLLVKKRKRKTDLLLFLGGIGICVAFSVLVGCIIKAGRPTFYYHTHKPGTATLKIFGMEIGRASCRERV